ncbi:unnamed protein product [Arctia plantaginis]|uniref:Uncharacterized protein n=1 Tax=Arctia plantaginis TaxID=874455 RepID=A0A8S0ZVS2_ARCPL|nr:unnamed protein product [Arctia plantaginis]
MYFKVNKVPDDLKFPTLITSIGVGIRQRLFAKHDSVTFTQAVKLTSSLEEAERDDSAVEGNTTMSQDALVRCMHIRCKRATTVPERSWQWCRTGALHGREVDASGTRPVLVFHRARPVPYALRERIDAELDRMLRAIVIKPDDCSDWALSLMPFTKAYDKVLDDWGNEVHMHIYQLRRRTRSSLVIPTGPLQASTSITPEGIPSERSPRISLTPPHRREPEH